MSLKCEIGLHDWKTTKRVRVCKQCSKRQWRSIDSEGRYMNQEISGMWMVRWKVRRMDDEDVIKTPSMQTGSLYALIFTLWRVIKHHGAYEIDINWSPKR